MAGWMCTTLRHLKRTNLSSQNISLGELIKQSQRCLTYSTVNRNNESNKGGFLKSLWDSVHISAPSDAHSKTLTDDNSITYEIVFETIKPEFTSEYLKTTGEVQSYLNTNDNYPGSLVGSWTTLYGDVDQAVHLWMYKEGYYAMSQKEQFERENEDFQNYKQQKAKWLNSRRNQICHHFGYWGEPKPRQPSHIYELRSYSLKPGTLIEWGNKWGQAISIRQKDAVGVFFSQIGKLYQVHHVWAYKDLAHRRNEREKMWEQPGWDDCVAATLPLVREMNASILTPNSHSPLQ